VIHVTQFRCIKWKRGREILDAASAAPDDRLLFNPERDSKVVRPALSTQNLLHRGLSALSTRQPHAGSSGLQMFLVQHL
jgi:hypothetical protein